MADRCIFCEIIAGKLPATIIEDTPTVMVIKDIAPKAPIHYLIIPKKHVNDCASLSEQDSSLPGDIMFTAQRIAQRLSGSKSFRLIINNGADSGQSVFHLHAHFISGKKLIDF